MGAAYSTTGRATIHVGWKIVRRSGVHHICNSTWARPIPYLHGSQNCEFRRPVTSLQYSSYWPALHLHGPKSIHSHRPLRGLQQFPPPAGPITTFVVKISAYAAYVCNSTWAGRYHISITLNIGKPGLYHIYTSPYPRPVP